MGSAARSCRVSTRPGQVAQLAEHAAENRGVGSSILPLATKNEQVSVPALPSGRPDMGSVAAEGMAGGGGLLFGRRTYEDFSCAISSPTAVRSPRLVDTKTTTTGVVMATDRTVQPEEKPI
jgi:hypothetical protein